MICPKVCQVRMPNDSEKAASKNESGFANSEYSVNYMSANISKDCSWQGQESSKTGDYHLMTTVLPQKSTKCWSSTDLTKIVMVACLSSTVFGLSLGTPRFQIVAFAGMSCVLAGTPGLCKIMSYGSLLGGAAIGSLAAGATIECSKHPMFVLNNWIVVLGILTSLSSTKLDFFLLGEFLTGVGTGLISVCVPSFIAEVAPSRSRGRYIVFHQLAITIGVLVSVLLSEVPRLTSQIRDEKTAKHIDESSIYSSSREFWWRAAIACEVLPCLILAYFLTFVYKFDTPYFLARRGRLKEARLLSEQFGHTPEDLIWMTKNCPSPQDLRTANKWRHRIKTYTLGWTLAILQQLSGVNVFVTTCYDLFLQAGFRWITPTLTSIILLTGNCVMTIPAISLVEKVGRKLLLLWGCIGMTVSITPVAVMFHMGYTHTTLTGTLAITGTLVYILFFSVSFGPVFWVHLVEMFPLSHRGSGIGTVASCHWISALLIIWINSKTSISNLYLIFAATSLLATLIVLFFVLDTKGRAFGQSPYFPKQALPKFNG